MERCAGQQLPLVDDPRPAVRISSRIGLAAIFAAAGLVVVHLLEPVLSRPYYFPAFGAVIVSAVLAGARAGCLTTALFAAGYVYWYFAPRNAWGVKEPHEITALVAYTLTGVFVALVGGALRRSYRALGEQHALLDRTVAHREDLLRALTHDIRSPLSVISMNADLLARALDAGSAERRRALTIKKNVASIESMLRDLVKVVALESGNVKLQAIPVDLAALVRHLAEGLAGTLAMDRVRIAIPPDLPPLRADPARFERVLVNLLSNALKYSSGPVHVTARLDGGAVVVAVRDEGPGIAPADLPRVFEKYFRAAGTRSREGLGLGLYISRLLVEAHGGRIWAVSEPARGSTFHVALPVSTERRTVDPPVSRVS